MEENTQFPMLPVEEEPTLARRHVRRAKSRKKHFGITGWVLIILAVWFLLVNPLSISWADVLPFLGKTADVSGDWKLILVNDEYRLPEDYPVELTELSNGEQVDSRMYPALQEMFDAMRADGVYPIVASGYRTAEEQQKLLDERIQEYRDDGYSRKSAKEAALLRVAKPGTSEHQLGLAVDINQEGTRSTASQVYTWLEENAWEYGFIQRYPEDKTEITGITNEPWHYRYVGKEAAKIMYGEDLCLEEYLEKYCS